MKILFKFLLVSLLLGIAYSCSDDKDKEDDGGEKPKVKLLPVKIISDKGQEYSFVYNDKEQLETLIDKKTYSTTSKTDIYTYTFSYDAHGMLTQFTKNYGSTSIDKVYNISYDKSMVRIDNEHKHYQFKTDDKGRATFFEKIWDEGGNKSSARREEQTYDNYSNLLKVMFTDISYENNPYYEYSKDIYITEYEYSTLYNPFINLNLPPWFLLTYNSHLNLGPEFADLPFRNMTGTHMPKKSNNIFYQYGDGKLEKHEDGTYYSDIKIISDQDNYPITYRKTGEDSDKGGTFSAQYTIEYKTMK